MHTILKRFKHDASVEQTLEEEEEHYDEEAQELEQDLEIEIGKEGNSITPNLYQNQCLAVLTSGGDAQGIFM